MRKPFSLRGCLLAAIALSFLRRVLGTGQHSHGAVRQSENGTGGELEGRRQRLCRGGGRSWITPGVHCLGVGKWTSQHAVVWYSSKWKEVGEQDPKLKSVEADIARLFARLDTVTDSLETWIDEIQPDMVVRSKEVPPMVRVGRTRAVSGKMDELKALFRDQIVPAVKKSGATDYGAAVARYGTPSE